MTDERIEPAGGPAPARRRPAPRHASDADARLPAAPGGDPVGQPLRLVSVPFNTSSESVLKGLIGPPAWSVRLKRIHDGRQQLTSRLDAAWADLARRCRNRPADFVRRWQAYVDALDLAVLNTLIETHNAYYLIETRIPVSYPSGRVIIPEGIEYPQQSITTERLLDDYPPDLDMALYFSER